uniref:HORMA domain-containing protein n=1 Tax=Macrostomum lignano TaxID=282301 RepID=A0A1I8HU86_9PLAT
MVGSLVEAYYFKFDYFIIDGGQDGISVNVHRETVAPLTDNVVMKMRLFYNGNTPDEYEPPGFRADPDSPARLPEEEIELRLGDVFHMMLSTGRDYFRDSASNKSNSKRQQQGKKARPNKQLTPASGAAAAAVSPSEVSELSDANNNNLSGSAVADNEEAGDIGDDEEEELSVRCPCERDADMGIMIRCEACELWQHAVCFGILRESEAPPVHYCEVCIESKFLCETGNLADNSHDQLLQRMRAPVERRSFCLVRAALNALLELNDPVTPGRLSERLSVPVQSAGSLVKKLVELGALAAPSAGAGASDYVIDRVLLRRQLLPKFFGRACRSGGAGGFEESSSKASADSNAEVAMEDKRKKQPEAGQTAGGRKRPGRPPGKRGAGAAAGAATTPKSRRAGGASSKRGRYGSVVNTPLKI